MNVSGNERGTAYMAKKKIINYRAIPGIGHGYTSLSIYPPSTFINNKDFAVFVGGCGVGHKATLAEAKAHLLESAKRYCIRRSSDAQAIVEHYDECLKRLECDGLVTIKEGQHA